MSDIFEEILKKCPLDRRGVRLGDGVHVGTAKQWAEHLWPRSSTTNLKTHERGIIKAASNKGYYRGYRWSFP